MQRKSNRRGQFIEKLESRTLLSVPEPNNTLATAHTIFGGKPFAGTNTFTDAITATDPIDIFKIFTDAPGTLVINIKNNTAVLGMTLIQDKNANGVEDAGERLKTINAIAGIGGSISVVTTQHLPIETYFFQLVRATTANTNYALEISYDTAGSTLATARPLNDSSGAFGRHELEEGVNFSDNSDFYSFSFDPRVSSGVIDLEVITASPTSLYHIDLFRDSNNNRLIDAGEFLKTFENFSAPTTLTAGATYFLRIVRSVGAVENYTLRTQFDYAGSSIGQARNISGIDEHKQDFRDQVASDNFITVLDSDDFYRFSISSPQSLCFQLILMDANPTTNQLIAKVIRDVNNDGNVASNEVVFSVATAAGIVTTNTFLASPGVYFLDMSGTGSAFPHGGNYSLTISGDRIPGIIPGNSYLSSRDLGTLNGRLFDDGALGPSDGVHGDVSDSFKVKLPVAGKLSAKLFNLEATVITGRLNVDSNGNGVVDPGELITTFNPANPLNRDLPAGTYFVTVTGSTREYEVELIPDFAGDVPGTERNMGTLGAFTQAMDHISVSDVDVYKFAVSGTHLFTANAMIASGDGANVALTLSQDLGGGLTNVITALDGTGGFTQLLSTLTTGNYFLAVSGTGDADYTLGFSTGDNDDSIPEALLTANHRLIVGDSRGFTIDSPSDVDMILINLDRTGDTAFGVDIDSRNGSSFDTFVRVFDPNGNQLASNDDGAAPGETLSKFSFLTFTVPANFNSDFVFVAVSSAQNKNYNALTGGGDAGGSATGQYTINITPFTPPSGWIGGFVYNDRNRNGRKDANDVALAGRTIFIDLDNDGRLDANEPTAVTDATGEYIFKGLEAGTYKLRLLEPRGWKQTFPTNNSALSVTIETGEHSRDDNFFVRHGKGRHLRPRHTHSA